MGSGSSKSAPKPPAKVSVQPPKKPVANVNKDEPEAPHQRGTVEEGFKPPKVDTKETNLHLSGPIAPIPTNRSVYDEDKENSKKAKKDKSKTKITNDSSLANSGNPTALQFEDDSDVDDDIDAVLKIPLAMESNKQSKGRDKKSKRDIEYDKENIDSHQMRNDYHGYNGHSDIHAQQSQEALPETYAQRLQRQQYKLQRDMLIREKTSIRNMRDWNQDDEGDEDNDEDLTPRAGFDASKFRAANKGGEPKKDLFSTVKDDLETPRYLQSSGQDMDDVEVNRRESESLSTRLPHYNQSEIDLMRQLEEEMML